MIMLADPEEIVRDYLVGRGEITTLVATRIATSTVSDLPCIRVTRLPLGAPLTSRVLYGDRAILQLDCFAGIGVDDGSDDIARRIGQTARAVLALPEFIGIHAGGVICDVEFGAFGSLPDDREGTAPGHGRARYIATVAVVTRPLTGT